jgi:hypothetical protein
MRCMSSSPSDDSVPPNQERPSSDRPTGLAAIAGTASEWEDLPEVVDEIYRSRHSARDRDDPNLD